MKQLSDEWFSARLGKVTASRLNDVAATIKSGEAASRRDYKTQLVVERLTGIKAAQYSNQAMEWGMEQEANARDAYQFVTGFVVDEQGFIDHPEIEMTGASPDGLVGDGTLEIKCPNSTTHIEYLLAGVAPAKYHNQMLWQMECAGRKWCDFVSYDPRMPLELQLFVVRFDFDEARVKILREEVQKFLAEVSAMVGKLKEKME